MTTSTTVAESPWIRLHLATGRRALYDVCIACGYASDPIVRGWFALAQRAEAGRLVDVSGWPVLTTRDVFTLVRGWGRTLRDLGEPVADVAARWQSDARDHLFILRREPLRGPTDVFFESVKQWSAGARTAIQVAAAARSRPAERVKMLAGAIAGVELLATRLGRRQ